MTNVIENSVIPACLHSALCWHPFYEKWKPVKGYEDCYLISNYGRLKTLERIDCKGQRRNSFIRRLSFDKNGYLLSCLSKDRVNKMVKIHRLVAAAFLPNPDDKAEVNHLKGVKFDNRSSELEWSTSMENMRHAEGCGIRKTKGVDNAAAKLSESNVLDIFQSTKKHEELSKQYGIGVLQISRIKIGYNWSHITGKVYTAKEKHILDPEVVRNIFNESADNQGISKKYNVPQYTVANIRRGRVYSNITGKNHVKKSKQQNNPAPTVMGAW